LDELLRQFVAVRFGDSVGDLAGQSLVVRATDVPAAASGADWLVRFTEAGIEVTAESAAADVVLRGPAADLYLALWRRRPMSTIDVVGDEALAQAFHDTVVV
ncbi:MAG TPA: hypothetical protein VGM93_07780, partial [Acidimicrobiales bacterium]